MRPWSRSTWFDRVRVGHVLKALSQLLQRHYGVDLANVPLFGPINTMSSCFSLITPFSRSLLLGSAFATAVIVGSDLAYAQAPELDRLVPAGLPRGQVETICLLGDELDKTLEVLMYLPGLRVNRIAIEDDESASLTVEATNDCPLGPHPIRLVNGHGLSNVGVIWVGTLPNTQETEPNNNPAQAQLIEADVVVNGVITDGDRDAFAFTMDDGETISIEVLAARLGPTPLDTLLTVIGPDGTVLYEIDDTPLLGLDAHLTFRVPSSGTYTILLRESAYGGSPDGAYRLSVGHFPRPACLLPLGGRPGESLTFRDPARPDSADLAPVILPRIAEAIVPVVVHDSRGTTPSANRVRVVDLPSRFEPGLGGSYEPASAPVAFQGIIAETGQIDRFQVTLEANGPYEIRSYARSLGSPLDPIVEVRDPESLLIVRNDDSATGHDSQFRLWPTVDGDFEIQIGDHLGRGGPSHGYRIEVEPVRERLALTIAEPDRDPQVGRGVIVPRGGRSVTLISARRENVEGPVDIDLSGLPEGVSAWIAPFDPMTHLTPLVFEAESSAPLGAGLVGLQGRVTDSDGEVVEGRWSRRIPIVTDGEAYSYQAVDVDRLAVAVVDPAPFAITAVEPNSDLVRDGEATWMVRVTRDEGFDGRIQLTLPFQPPWIDVPPTPVNIRDETEVAFSISSTAEAVSQTWNLIVEAEAVVDGREVATCSAPVTLNVREPLVQARLVPAELPQGSEGVILCELEWLEPPQGSLVIELENLPRRVEADPVTVQPQPDQRIRQIELPLTLAEDAAIGATSELSCRITVDGPDGRLIHRTARGGQLKVVEGSGASTGTGGRPLSKLERLRRGRGPESDPPR